MTLHFLIEYKTAFGEELFLNILAQDGSGEVTASYRMATVEGLTWTYDMEVAASSAQVRYYYSVGTVYGEKSHEWVTMPHVVEFTAMAKEYSIIDQWMVLPEDSYRYSSAFTDCVNRRRKAKMPESYYKKTLRLQVRAPQLREGERLAIVGSDAALGAWNTAGAVEMTEHTCNEWAADIDAGALASNTVDVKFVVFNDKSLDFVMWEECQNRTLTIPDIKDGETVVLTLDQAFFAMCDQKFAGLLIPVFSLRSESSFGVGDFGDLKKMIDWVAETKQRVLQVLPINDTTTTHTWTDSYPYSCISIFALHPQYVDLTKLPAIADKAKAAEYEALRQELNALPQVDYERVNKAKTEIMHIIFEQTGKKTLASKDFKAFFEDTKHWLVPYAQFCYLRDTYGTAVASQWPDHKQWDESERDTLCDRTGEWWPRLAFHFYVQYILSRQMEEVHVYSRARGVILKGDIPIGVSRYGCDVWQEPKYFNLDGQAGAPPDGFSVNGQNWGFPTYNWDAMTADGCTWWVRRFRNMAKYFDAYRIDHVLGFFRIWEIPIHSVHGLLGQFSPAVPMSPDEIQSYGLNFQEDLFTKPFIAEWVLWRVFGEHTDEVKQKYLNHSHDDIFVLKPEYDTQRKIEKAFEGCETDKDIWIRDGLYCLVSDVLFVRDRKDPSKYHPRITAQLNFMYEALYGNDKEAFNRLYNEYYYSRNNNFWYGEAMKKLPLLVQATRMLVCAEDLGMVPGCVPWVMSALRILSLEVQSMPKSSKEKFGNLAAYPYRSVCTLSSHDMPTLRQWWDENYDNSQDYYNNVMYYGGPAPHPLPGWLAKDIIWKQLTCPSMLCILSLQDWLSIDEKLRLSDPDGERINIPAIAHHYWRYRMHITIEQLMSEKVYNDKIKEMIIHSGRM